MPKRRCNTHKHRCNTHKHRCNTHEHRCNTHKHRCNRCNRCNARNMATAQVKTEKANFERMSKESVPVSTRSKIKSALTLDSETGTHKARFLNCLCPSIFIV